MHFDPDPATDPTTEIATLTRTFRTKVTVCSCGCWLFATTDRYGYGRYKFNGRNVAAHRFAYDRLVADVPDDFDIDHLCDRHRNCVNPHHMEPVPKSENARRANARRWHGGNPSQSQD